MTTTTDTEQARAIASEFTFDSPIWYDQLVRAIAVALAKEREATWDKAIEVVRGESRVIQSGEDYNEFHGLLAAVIAALVAARKEGNSK